MQSKRESEEIGALVRSAQRSLTEFEQVSSAWQQLGRTLDGALRDLGDVGTLLTSLQSEAAGLSSRIVSLAAAQEDKREDRNGAP
jgi:hypothetical protein